MGRFGNQVMQYLFARAYADRHGYDFQCEQWIGQMIFSITDHPVTCLGLPCRNEIDARGEGDINLRCYAQSKDAMIYTRAQAAAWLTLRPEINSRLNRVIAPLAGAIIAHRRCGDYIGYGYPVVSLASYYRACEIHGLTGDLVFSTEENPLPHRPFFPDKLAFLPDFYRLIQAPILLRGNSSFSWVAGLLNKGRVFCPVIDGLTGGIEHDVEFIPGNHKRFTNLSFVTDLHLPL